MLKTIESLISKNPKLSALVSALIGFLAERNDLFAKVMDIFKDKTP